VSYSQKRAALITWKTIPQGPASSRKGPRFLKTGRDQERRQKVEEPGVYRGEEKKRSAFRRWRKAFLKCSNREGKEVMPREKGRGAGQQGLAAIVGQLGTEERGGGKVSRSHQRAREISWRSLKKKKKRPKSCRQTKMMGRGNSQFKPDTFPGAEKEKS